MILLLASIASSNLAECLKDSNEALHHEQVDIKQLTHNVLGGRAPTYVKLLSL